METWLSASNWLKHPTLLCRGTGEKSLRWSTGQVATPMTVSRLVAALSVRKPSDAGRAGTRVGLLAALPSAELGTQRLSSSLIGLLAGLSFAVGQGLSLFGGSPLQDAAFLAGQLLTLVGAAYIVRIAGDALVVARRVNPVTTPESGAD
jgi:hypothetical protein